LGHTVDIGLWAEGSEAGKGSIGVCVDAGCAGVELGGVAEPQLGEGGHGGEDKSLGSLLPDPERIGSRTDEQRSRMTDAAM